LHWRSTAHHKPHDGPTKKLPNKLLLRSASITTAIAAHVRTSSADTIRDMLAKSKAMQDELGGIKLTLKFIYFNEFAPDDDTKRAIGARTWSIAS